MGVTADPNDPRLTHGPDPADSGYHEQAGTYLVLSPEERAKGFVRPVRLSYWHVNGSFIAATLGVIVWEMTYAWDHNPDTMPWTDLLANYVPAPVTYVLLALLVAWLPGHIAYAIHRVKGAQATATPAAMGANVSVKPAWWRWLHDDARNRAWRTFLHTVAAAALLGGLDAGGQLLRDGLSQTMAGQIGRASCRER